MKVQRKGIVDVWNASLLRGANWTSNENPSVTTTALAPPNQIISYRYAKKIQKKMKDIDPEYKRDEFVHFYLDDNQFDAKTSGIWARPDRLFEIASHFVGIIGPDFSIYADFPTPLKRFQIYSMRTLEFACASKNIPTIVNARWGSEDTWAYTIDELPKNSMLAIGTVGSRLKYLENQYCFEAGFMRMLDTKTPHTLVVVGSTNYPCFEEAKRKGVRIVQFDGETCKYFKERKKV